MISASSTLSFLSILSEPEKPSRLSLHHVQETVYRLLAVVMTVYSLYSLFCVIAFVSHLGARVPVLRNVLMAGGFAQNEPVETVLDLFVVNGAITLGFVLSHSLLRPPTLQKYVGFRLARLLYCAISGLTLHVWLLYFRPLNMTSGPITEQEYVYDESNNIPLFTLPYPRIVQDYLSTIMLVYSYYAMLSDPTTYVVLGFNRTFYGPGNKEHSDRFPKEVTPRMDIITWIGFCTFLKGGSVAFFLFSGMSIMPHKVYAWDIIVRVVAAAYLRWRSKGFNIFVGKIETTHHTIWMVRAGLAGLAIWSQRHLIPFSDFAILLMMTAGVLAGLALHQLEQLK